jgi:CO/xanthine dehydrogenase Mo-binding subunit
MNQGVSVPHVGRSVARRDAEAKVRGREKFAADYYGERFLWAGVKRAGVPHAVLKGVQTEAAARLPGVVAVLTSRDVRGTNRQGVIRKDQPVLVDDRIRHRGDAVALVLAEDRQALERAIAAISIDCDPLPGVFDMEAALGPGACRIHPDHAGGNTLLQGKLETGDVEAALAECDAVIEGRFDLPVQEHAYLETEAGWAVCREDGRLEIVASTQTPFRDRTEVAEAIGLDATGVRIIAPYCGGAFGGKDGITVQSLLGLAALRCPGRPVKMWWGREESFVAGSKRHRARLYYRAGAMKDGSLHAVDVRAYYDTGPYDHLGGAVMALGLEHAAGPYRIPNVRLRGWAVYTNNPIGGAFRGFGVPQVTAGMEQMIDRLAWELDISPLEMRLRNAVRRGDRNAAGVTLTTSTGIEDCLRTLAVHPLYTGRATWKAEAGTHARRGAGIACVMHGMGYGPVVPDAANAKIELTREGRFRVYAGVVDMGQGNASTYLQIAADILNQDMDRVDLVLPDTDLTLPSGSASASRTTYTFGNALIHAAEALKGRVLDRAADLLMARGRDELALIPGGLRHLPSGRDIQLADMARRLDAAERTATYRFRAPTAVETLSADPSLRLHGVPHLIFSYGAHFAGVEVDLLTGQVRVAQYLAVTDAGTLINPQLFDQQIQGGIAQGLGYGLCEEFGVEQGAVTTPDLATYVIPGALDVPDMVSVPIRQPEHTGPYGLKGVGEVAVDGPLPAVANALADACGIRLERFPMTAERVLDALEQQRRKTEGGVP